MESKNYGNGCKAVSDDTERVEMKVCVNCWGYEPCLCGNSKYIEMWDFVYWAMMRCRG